MKVMLRERERERERERCNLILLLYLINHTFKIGSTMSSLNSRDIAMTSFSGSDIKNESSIHPFSYLFVHPSI